MRSTLCPKNWESTRLPCDTARWTSRDLRSSSRWDLFRTPGRTEYMQVDLVLKEAWRERRPSSTCGQERLDLGPLPSPLKDLPRRRLTSRIGRMDRVMCLTLSRSTESTVLGSDSTRNISQDRLIRSASYQGQRVPTKSRSPT